MESSNNKSVIAAIIAVVVLIAGGLGIWALTQNDEETTEPTVSEVVEQEPAPAAPVEEPLPNIVEAAVATPSLTILVTGVTEAGLVETLSGEGPFTVLAPDDDAFAAALEELDITAEELLAREDLADILTYHVISGSVLSSDLTDGQEVTTVQGGTLTVDITEEGVFFVDANDRRALVKTADVETSNGVVHIIDAVLLP